MKKGAADEASDVSTILRSFERRIGVSSVWSWFAYRAPRAGLLVALALVPALLIAFLAIAGPRAFTETVSDPNHVHETFSRLASVIATVSSIAVSIAALILRRELRGVAAVRSHHKADLEYRDEVREELGSSYLPLGIGAFLDTLLEGVQRAARQVGDAAGATADRVHVHGTSLADFVDAIDRSATRTQAQLRRWGHDPAWLLNHVLDFELRTTESLARSFARATDLPAELHDALEVLRERVGSLVTGVHYAKTLATQWELSRMSFAILVTTFPSLVVSVLLVLAYDDWTVALLGARGAALVVSAAFGLALLPLTAFGSHLMRIVFLNQFTLPTAGFGLGPEEPEAFGQARTRHEA